MDDHDEEHRRYGDSTILEPIIEQQDDEMTTSPMSSSSMDTSFVEEERRSREEIQQFEELEKEFASNRRGVRVKFDDEQLSPIAQTTVIKTEPYFQINSTEDQVTKHFYHNEFPSKTEEQNKYSRQTSSKTPSELDSLEEEYIVAFQKQGLSYKTNKEIYHKIIDSSDQVSFSSPGKSILKKSQKQEKISARSPSPSSLKKKHSPSFRSDSNEVLHLAEVTAKETASHPSAPLRSLFEPTINIFNTSYSNQSQRPSRLRYYIKPYRGEAYISPDINKQRSRSLSEQRLAQQSGPTVWYTFPNQYNRPFNRKQHVSWSPVRDYIHQGRDKIPKALVQRYKNKQSTLSSSNPCLRSSSSMIPISIHDRSSQNPSSSLDSYETSSLTTRSLTPVSQYEDKKEMIFSSPLPDIVHPNKKEHNETIQRYDRLLEKMRATDEQLHALSRSWTNNIQQRTSINTNKTTNNREFLSPMILQMCLLILVIFNLLVVYFFNEINVLWSQYISNTVIAEQHDEGTSNF